ncbi:hypothetical protein [Paenibacillus cremeus]|uniref:Uncharacterized protein n=1 Tax=Paenibacillus cremeus TaxID=2163881 RepID=A0A559KIT6_9BACL|nr:hypothetical protein [Paenibacillus cremeus]TVY11988.1 hypothetical protein FPZ49_01545 [Paenibacillus cremeus]
MRGYSSMKHMGRAALAVVLSAVLVVGGNALPGRALAAEDAAGAAVVAQVPSAKSYALTDKLQVEVKSLLNETTSDCTRIGIVVRLRSSAAKVAKLPDLDVRVKTADGYEYPLQASVFNAHAIRPQTTEELSYMVTVDRRDPIELTELTWVDVDWYSYPKQETVQLAMPIDGAGWTGPLSNFADGAAAELAWGQSFSLAAPLESQLTYTPVAVSKDNTPQGPVTTVQLRVENPSATKKEALPDFVLDGKAAAASAGGPDRSVFSGKRVEQGPIVLEPKEKRYIHFVIPTEKDTVLSAVNVLTPETFRQMDAKGNVTASSYTVGRFHIVLPAAAGGIAAAEFAAAKLYAAGEPFAFDRLSDAIDPSMDISLAELHRHENEGEGYQTVIAKLTLSNKGDLPVPLPAFQTKLLTAQGLTYSGSRQAGTVSEIMPKTNYVVSYAFNVPTGSEDSSYVLKLTDAKTAAPAVTTIGAYKLELQSADSDSVLNLKRMDFYPFTVNLTDWAISGRTNMPSSLAPGPITYSYRLMLSMDIERDERVMVDQNFSKMQLELVDPTGKQVSVRTISFTGVNRLISGKQYITFDNLKTDEQLYPLSVNIYETITTATGEAKRLVGVLQQ